LTAIQSGTPISHHTFHSFSCPAQARLSISIAFPRCILLLCSVTLSAASVLFRLRAHAIDTRNARPLANKAKKRMRSDSQRVTNIATNTPPVGACHAKGIKRPVAAGRYVAIRATQFRVERPFAGRIRWRVLSAVTVSRRSRQVRLFEVALPTFVTRRW
jgi:hypothetical protein